MSARRVTKLPDLPSDLIRLALRDLKQVEKMKKTYRVDMGTWFEAKDSHNYNKCAVCFAGSVMARTCKLDPKDIELGFTDAVNTLTDDLDASDKFIALDNFREGYVKRGLNRVFNITKYVGDKGINFPGIMDRHIVKYEKDKRKFKQQMANLANDLAAVGL